jgi:methylated-DNA-[protein]-cysteine S-methyltransferase
MLEEGASEDAMATSFHLFETALGWVAIVWNERGVTQFFLPQRDRAALQRRLAAKAAGATPSPSPPPLIAEIIDRVRRYCEGEAVEFSDVAVDLDGVDGFRRAIYDAARQLKFGETATYGELAARSGHPGLARETGQALGANPAPLIIPCHRILAAGGRIGGFSAPGGSATKHKMLALEGVRVGPPEPAQQSFGF